eukprot:scaffold1287_cov253-Ochromonas_danica.AAC.18
MNRKIQISINVLESETTSLEEKLHALRKIKAILNNNNNNNNSITNNGTVVVAPVAVTGGSDTVGTISNSLTNSSSSRHMVSTSTPSLSSNSARPKQQQQSQQKEVEGSLPLDDYQRKGLNQLLLDNVLKMILKEDKWKNPFFKQLVRVELYLLLGEFLQSSTLFGSDITEKITRYLGPSSSSLRKEARKEQEEDSEDEEQQQQLDRRRKSRQSTAGKALSSSPSPSPWRPVSISKEALGRYGPGTTTSSNRSPIGSSHQEERNHLSSSQSNRAGGGGKRGRLSSPSNRLRTASSSSDQLDDSLWPVTKAESRSRRQQLLQQQQQQLYHVNHHQRLVEDKTQPSSSSSSLLFTKSQPLIRPYLEEKTHQSHRFTIKNSWKPRPSVLFNDQLGKEWIRPPGSDPSNFIDIDRRLGYQKSRMWFPQLPAASLPMAEKDWMMMNKKDHMIGSNAIVQQYLSMRALASYVGDLIVPHDKKLYEGITTLGGGEGEGGSGVSGANRSPKRRKGSFVPGSELALTKLPKKDLVDAQRYNQALSEAMQMWTPILSRHIPAPTAPSLPLPLPPPPRPAGSDIRRGSTSSSRKRRFQQILFMDEHSVAQSESTRSRQKEYEEIDDEEMMMMNGDNEEDVINAMDHELRRLKRRNIQSEQNQSAIR